MNNVEGQFGYTNTYFKNGNLETQLLTGTYKDYMQNRYNLNYKFSYDYSNRLLNAQNINQGDNTYSVFNTYDKDGNLTTLKRYGDYNILTDNFVYTYSPGTNKLTRVSSTTDQFRHDLNGNTINDELNGNYNILYDHRNLITELYHLYPNSETPYTTATRYYYDESGNRVRKLTYFNTQYDPLPVIDWNNLKNPGNSWQLLNNEFYLKGADGKDLATYEGQQLQEWYVWGNDIVGKIKGEKAYYYYKDHLGSVRAVIDEEGSVVAGYDYDAWGYPLENRNYNGDSIKFKYTGKELDKESFYDYFGARYYDARIGRWGQVDSLLNKHLSITPYSYSLNNPMITVDPNGKDPIREQLGSQNSVIEILKANIGKSILDIGRDIFGGQQGQGSRYIYTKERGILDLQHFFAAAHQSKKWGFEPALNRGVLQELAQSLGIGFDKRSAFNPEDLSSNLQGAILGRLLNSTQLTSENVEIISEFLISLKVIDPNDPSIAESNVYIPTLKDYKEGYRLPLRYTYDPYYGETVGFINK